MIPQCNSIVKITIFTIIIIGANLNKFEALGIPGQDGLPPEPPACYRSESDYDNCTNFLEEKSWNLIANFTCCEDDHSHDYDLYSCCLDLFCNYYDVECFNNLLVADLLNQNPCNNTNTLKIKERADFVWNFCKQAPF